QPHRSVCVPVRPRGGIRSQPRHRPARAEMVRKRLEKITAELERDNSPEKLTEPTLELWAIEVVLEAYEWREPGTGELQGEQVRPFTHHRHVGLVDTDLAAGAGPRHEHKVDVALGLRHFAHSTAQRVCALRGRANESCLYCRRQGRARATGTGQAMSPEWMSRG